MHVLIALYFAASISPFEVHCWTFLDVITFPSRAPRLIIGVREDRCNCHRLPLLGVPTVFVFSEVQYRFSNGFLSYWIFLCLSVPATHE